MNTNTNWNLKAWVFMLFFTPRYLKKSKLNLTLLNKKLTIANNTKYWLDFIRKQYF